MSVVGFFRSECALSYRRFWFGLLFSSGDGGLVLQAAPPALRMRYAEDSDTKYRFSSVYLAASSRAAWSSCSSANSTTSGRTASWDAVPERPRSRAPVRQAVKAALDPAGVPVVGGAARDPFANSRQLRPQNSTLPTKHRTTTVYMVTTIASYPPISRLGPQDLNVCADPSNPQRQI